MLRDTHRGAERAGDRAEANRHALGLAQHDALTPRAAHPRDGSDTWEISHRAPPPSKTKSRSILS